MWPDFTGLSGWEAADFESDSPPLRFDLPTPRQCLWYEPETLGVGVGAIAPSEGFGFDAGQFVVRVQGDTIQATLTELRVFDIAFLDSFFVLPTFAPCSLRLTIYEEDRTTVYWQVHSDPAQPNPYLMDPGNYATQELDIAAGAVSIGSVTVPIIDPATIAGDQDSGWMTARLAYLGLPDVAGRRAKLERFVGETIPPVVIADGPLSHVALAEYSRYEATIRDTRDTERRARLSGGGSDLSLLPFGVFNGYGYADELTGNWLLPPTSESPLVATFSEEGFDWGGVIWEWDPNAPPAPPRRVGKVDVSGNATVRLIIPIEAWRELGGRPDLLNLGTSAQGIFNGNTRLMWRIATSGDPYTEVQDLHLWGGVLICGGSFGTCPYEMYPDATDPTSVLINYFSFSGTADTMPEDTDSIELVILGGGSAVSQYLPFIVENITAGELARMAYDGEFSPRGPLGEIVPTGIRYSPTALALMTDLVRVRLTAPVTDIRSWLESHLYAPTGWVPALDTFARISPISQVRPDDVLSLPRLDNTNAEPSSEWNSGERVINVLRFVYFRDFKPGLGPTYGPYPLQRRDVVIEYRDEDSITRHGEQMQEIRGDLFTAIGLPDGEPLAAGLEAETGWLLAADRDLYVRNRYSLGVPTIRVNFRRSLDPTIRAGSWVIVDLSWFPDYFTGRRGLLAVGQIVALGELDCHWRAATIEILDPPEAS